MAITLKTLFDTRTIFREFSYCLFILGGDKTIYNSEYKLDWNRHYDKEVNQVLHVL